VNSNEKKHFEARFGYERPYTNQIKTFRPYGNSNSQAWCCLEDEMFRKKRVPNINVQRNSLALGTPGDKFYRNPECSDGFYKMEGVISGSTFYFEKEKNKLGKTLSRQACSFFDYCHIDGNILNPEKLWTIKSLKEKFIQDSLYVKTITQWDKTFMKTQKSPTSNKDTKASGRLQVAHQNIKKTIILKNQKK
jgi:hypothetical protein